MKSYKSGPGICWSIEIAIFLKMKKWNPEDWKCPLFDFLIVAALSWLLVWSKERHHLEQEEPAEQLFGTDRTFTFIGILGFILSH